MTAAPLFADLPGDIRASFEFFPPKSEKMELQLWEAITQLAPLSPRFVSVTYGAGGSTRERTHATVARLVRETSLTPAAHLTCVGASRAEIAEIADSYWQAGVRHLVALRGDPPAGAGTPFTPHPQGYASAAELVARLETADLIRRAEDSLDRRRVLLTLSPEGERRLAVIARLQLRELSQHRQTFGRIVDLLPAR